jgi:hypothetical protein
VVWFGTKRVNIICFMETKRLPLAILALMFCFGSAAMAAPACNAKAKIPANARTFAKTTALDGWREFRDGEGVPDLSLNGGMSAQFWQDRSKNRTVYVVAPGQDYWTYTRYCFDSDGQLENVDFEVRTRLGWGLRAESSAASGFDATNSNFISLKSGKTIAKPDGVGDAPQALKPILYLRVNDLPFASMLTASAKPRRGKSADGSSARASSE